MNERIYGDDSFRRLRVRVTLIRKSAVEILARDAKSAEGVVNARAVPADGLDNAVESEQIGPAIEG